MDTRRFQRGRGVGRGQKPPTEGLPPPMQSRDNEIPSPQQSQQQIQVPEQQPAHLWPRFRGRGDSRALAPIPPASGLAQMTLKNEVEGAVGDKIRSSEPSRGTIRQRVLNLVTKLVTADLGPKQGTAGVPANLTANYFRVETRHEWTLYQYRVDFEPDEDRTPVRKALLRPHRDMIGTHLFDGTVLLTKRRLPEPCEVMSEKKEGTRVKIIIKLTTDVRRSDHQYTQFLNLILRKCLNCLNLQLVGRDYYDAHNKVTIREHNLEVWPGYLTSIRQAENEIMLNVDISHKVMRNETALELLMACRQRDRDGGYEALYTNSIVGTTVITRYNNKTYRVDDVDFRSTPLSTFPKKDNTVISYLDYYKQKYHIDIRDKSQPLLISVPKARDIRGGQDQNIVLVPELCCLTGITDEMRSNFHLMSAMGEHTRVRPGNRIEKLESGFINRMKNNEEVQKVLQEWEMRFSDKLVQFRGRILGNEEICFNNFKQKTDKYASFTGHLRNASMLKSAPISTWAIIYPTKMSQDVKLFVSTLIRSASSFQYGIPDPRREEIRDDRPGTYVMAIEKVFSQYTPNLVMCIVPNQRSDRYEAIKKKCYVDRSIPNQVVLAKNLKSKSVMSICSKIAIQLNCKLGGAPWMVKVPFNDRVMIAGFDVCHDARAKNKSFGALVCSLNNIFSRYYSAVSCHTNGEELSSDLALQFFKAVNKYREINEAFPNRIIFYRDGVGDGNIPYVLEHEISLIERRSEVKNGETAFWVPSGILRCSERATNPFQTRLRELTGADSPIRMCVVIVSKRINTRLFVNHDNPPPGTIADDVITCPERFDFFLVSQSVHQGTVSPTSYNVIYNSANMKPDAIQHLSYKMTHMYYNWTGTVRVPAQCQYAHKLAFMVSQYLHRVPNAGMDDLLYFL